jgi:hypothetical protein
VTFQFFARFAHFSSHGFARLVFSRMVYGSCFFVFSYQWTFHHTILLYFFFGVCVNPEVIVVTEVTEVTVVTLVTLVTVVAVLTVVTVTATAVAGRQW